MLTLQQWLDKYETNILFWIILHDEYFHLWCFKCILKPSLWILFTWVSFWIHDSTRNRVFLEQTWGFGGPPGAVARSIQPCLQRVPLFLLSSFNQPMLFIQHIRRWGCCKWPLTWTMKLTNDTRVSLCTCSAPYWRLSPISKQNMMLLTFKQPLLWLQLWFDLFQLGFKYCHWYFEFEEALKQTNKKKTSKTIIVKVRWTNKLVT